MEKYLVSDNLISAISERSPEALAMVQVLAETEKRSEIVFVSTKEKQGLIIQRHVACGMETEIRIERNVLSFTQSNEDCNCERIR